MNNSDCTITCLNCDKSRPKVLMITPFHKQNRGNGVTASRIRSGMEALGWNIDLCSLDERDNIPRLRREAVAMDYGLIHGFHALHLGNLLNEIQELKKLPILLTMTGTDLNSLRSDKLVDRITEVLDIAAAIVVFNADDVSFLSRVCPDWGKKTTLIPQGVAVGDGTPTLRTADEDRSSTQQDQVGDGTPTQRTAALSRAALGLSVNEIVFIIPSGLRAIKNIEMAVDAINAVINRGKKAGLIIAGPVIEREYAARLLSRINHNPAIKYLGEIEHSGMKPLYSLADVVVNSSYSEGQPQAALEAMSLGKPCILTAVPGNLNIIEDYREGIYVRNTEELAAAMDYFINDPQQLTTMGLAAQELIMNKFTVNSEINAYHSLYKQINN